MTWQNLYLRRMVYVPKADIQYYPDLTVDTYSTLKILYFIPIISECFQEDPDFPFSSEVVPHSKILPLPSTQF